MKDSWKGKNIDLKVLSDCICQFFTNEGFDVSLKRKKEAYIITVFPKSFHGISEKIFVYIKGKPDDFTVEFLPGPLLRHLTLFTPFYSLILGGHLYLKGSRSLEKIDELERRFWRFVDEILVRL
ncbi:MAG: hypothetical protein QXH40_01465 [Candidatus Bathyarchaeia archaeon]